MKLLPFLLLASFATNAQPLPTQPDVVRAMTVANAYFMAKWPAPGTVIITNKTRPSHIWTRAVYYEGLMALNRVAPQQRYVAYAVNWGQKHDWGMRSGTYTRNADDQCCAQTYIDLYQLDRAAGHDHPERIQAIKTAIDSMVRSAKIDDWTWVDALQMAMPVFARLSAMSDEETGTAYAEKMYQMYMHTKTKQGGNGLYNAQEHLWWRDKDFVPPYQEPNGRSCYWSRGNGWVLAALVRTMDGLPKNTPHRAEYERTYREMISALLPLQRPDGFWNVSLYDATNFGGKELTGTALFAYGMAWGLNHGLFEGHKEKPLILKAVSSAWLGMTTESLQPTGFLGYVQGTGKEPKDGQPVTVTSQPDFEDYGLGCFLLVGSELYQLAAKPGLRKKTR